MFFNNIRINKKKLESALKSTWKKEGGLPFDCFLSCSNLFCSILLSSNIQYYIPVYLILFYSIKFSYTLFYPKILYSFCVLFSSVAFYGILCFIPFSSNTQYYIPVYSVKFSCTLHCFGV